MMPVQVILVTHNSGAHLPGCLASLAEQSIPYQLTGIDNASTDDSYAQLRSHPAVTHLLQNKENLGFGRAVNQGFASSSTPYTLLLNPDVTLGSSTLAALTSFLETHPETAAVGPLQQAPPAGGWLWSVVPALPHWSALLAGMPGIRQTQLTPPHLETHWALNRQTWRAAEPISVPCLSGACLLLRREAAAPLGGFDEGYFMFFEDTDLGLRLRQAGWTLYVHPEAVVTHGYMGSVRHMGTQAQVILHQSGSRCLQQHGDSLTRLIWSLLGTWRSRKSKAAQNTHRPHTGHLFWKPVTGAESYWVEVSQDPAFVHAAANQVPTPECDLPQSLSSLRGKVFWRAAPVFPDGRLGRFTPRRVCAY